MPVLDYEIVTMGHGSGGLLTNQLLDKMIFDVLSNPMLDKRHDGAVFELDGPLAISTDSFVISPIFFPGGNIGELAVNGTVNDVAMNGAIPRYLTLSFIIEEGMPMTELWEIIQTVKRASNEAGVSIVTGDTKVVEKGSGDKIFINTTGVGQVHPKANIDSGRITPGDKILVSGPVATHGVSILSVREGLEFETTIKSDTACLNHVVVKLLNEFGENIKLLKDPTRGGVAAVLNEIAGHTNLGIEIESRQIPVLQEVKGACELLGLDPLYVANEGVFICFVDENVADKIQEHLSNLDGFSRAKIIGSVVVEHRGQVTIQSGIGGKRVVQMPVGEQLPRIC